MLKLSRLSDYGVVLMTHIGGCRMPVQSAQMIASATGIPVPTVSKLLSTFARAGLLNAVRGAKGGFRLARDPAGISVAAIISAIDGPIALTACLEGRQGACEIESLCPSRNTWHTINSAVYDVLDRLTLADLLLPPPLPVWKKNSAVWGIRGGHADSDAQKMMNARADVPAIDG